MRIETATIREQVYCELVNYFAYSQVNNEAGRFLDKHEAWLVDMIEWHGVTDPQELARLIDNLD